jgi:hypothetical protein
VKPEELQQWLQTFFAMEKLSRKMAIEELNAISNRLVQGWSRKRGVEWFKVQLKHKVAFRTTLRVNETC